MAGRLFSETTPGHLFVRIIFMAADAAPRSCGAMADSMRERIG